MNHFQQCWKNHSQRKVAWTTMANTTTQICNSDDQMNRRMMWTKENVNPCPWEWPTVECFKTFLEWAHKCWICSTPSKMKQHWKVFGPRFFFNWLCKINACECLNGCVLAGNKCANCPQELHPFFALFCQMSVHHFSCWLNRLWSSEVKSNWHNAKWCDHKEDNICD